MSVRPASMMALAEHWPRADFELRSRDPWQLLVCALLMAGTSPQRAEQVAAVVVERHGGPEQMADLHPCELEVLLRRLPHRRQKARGVVESGRAIRDRHAGRVPATLEELQSLPGVSRQAASLVVVLAHEVPAVIADEHLQRVLRRLGWIAEEDATAAEIALQQELQPQAWAATSARLSRLGRVHCRPKMPRCQGCPLAEDCPMVGVKPA